MKIDDLRDKWIKDHDFNTLIQHKDNKDVRFWVTALISTRDYYELTGWWISVQSEEPMVQETIRIKVADADGWDIVAK
jgi:hypothetical protein